jgi:glucose-1-phosphate cytidylyltransferase
LRAVPYDGFWAPMDTLKERTALEDSYRNGVSPWALWRDRPVDRGRPIVPVTMPSLV